MAEPSGETTGRPPLDLELGVIGNCQVAALVDERGSIVWSCLPRFDAEPAFSRLVDTQDRGQFAIEI